MPQVTNILIHEFDVSATPVFYDDEGDQMIGFYFQFTDEDDNPVSGLFGPYGYGKAAERAAMRAYQLKDY